MNLYRYYILCVLMVFMALFPVTDLSAQKKNTDNIVVSARIIDVEGEPIPYASVTSGSVTVFSDKNGDFSIKGSKEGVLLIEALGYEDIVISIYGGSVPEMITMRESDCFDSAKDQIERIDGGETSRRDFVGSVSNVDIGHLAKYSDLVISNGLQGKASGLVVRPTTNGLGMNVPDMYIRGLHTTGSNKALVVINGIERPLEDIMPEEIESISILKDPISKITYGPAAANGVIWVTTKRGEAYKRVINTTLELGVAPVTNMPEYLDSYDYAQYYNQARVNDGLTELYSPEQMDGYRNSTGMNDFLYPDIDFKKELTRNYTTYRKAAVEFFGGNKNIRYSMVVGYTGGTGLEKIGRKQDLDRFNVRGNLDIRVNDFINVVAGVGGRIEVKDWGAVSGASLFSGISQLRPNEYPVFLSGDDIGIPERDDEIPHMGASHNVSSNLYGDMMYGGKTSERYAASQTDLGVEFDLDKLVRGLKADAYVTFDNYNYIKQELLKYYPTYSREIYADSGGERHIRIQQRRNLNINAKDYSVTNSTVKRTLGWRFNLAYNRVVGAHDFSAVAGVRYYKDENKGSVRDDIELNNTLRLNYSYDKRYLAEFTAACMGSNHFSKDNRYFFSPAVGLGWIVSNEGFLKNARSVDFLKLKASFGILGFADNTGFDLFRTAWKENGSVSFNEQNTTKGYITSLVRYGSEDLKWESSSELNLGVEGLFFDKRLETEINYFHEVRDNIIGVRTLDFMSTIGGYAVASNMGNVKNQGVDASFVWADTPTRDFSYRVGLNFLYSKNKLMKADESSDIENYRKRIGKSTSSVFGLQSAGLFGKDVQLNGHPFQAFGYYKDGDIAYIDQNGDNRIDEKDQLRLGQTFPEMVWGLDFDLAYKGLGLYVAFTAENGVGKMMSSDYFWNRGEKKYSKLVLDSWHPTENPDGSYPRLTTGTGENNFRNSSFWYQKTDFLRLKNIELSYAFTNARRNSIYNKLRIFVRGTNVFVLSPFKELNPELPLSGISNYPAYSTYTAGLTFTF